MTRKYVRCRRRSYVPEMRQHLARETAEFLATVVAVGLFSPPQPVANQLLDKSARKYATGIITLAVLATFRRFAFRHSLAGLSRLALG
jgi:hypothetical protein